MARAQRHLVSRRSFLLGTVAAVTLAAAARLRALGAGSRVLRRAVMPSSELVSQGTNPQTVHIICRDAWGARPPTGEFIRNRVVRLTIHHSAVVLKDNRQAPQHFRDEQAYHQSLGWPDIAYHILIDRHGNVYKGRPFWARGNTRTDYDPTGHLLFMCEGNFEAERIPDAQVTALVEALAWASEHFGVSPRRIKGHRDYAATACPGKYLYALIRSGEIRRRVKWRLRHGGVRLVRLCGTAGHRRVRAIENGTD